jgi:hypothetical protein
MGVRFMRTPEQIEAMVPVSDRSAQRFPLLRDAQLAVVKRFAEEEARSFAPKVNRPLAAVATLARMESWV